MARRDQEGWPFQIGADMNRIAEELGSGRVRIASASSWEPLVDLVEEETRIVLKAEIPGVRGDAIDLSYIPERHSIVLSGVRDEDSESEQARLGVYQLEILYGRFEREVALPDVELAIDQIKAIYRLGFLIVLIPKKVEAS